MDGKIEAEGNAPTESQAVDQQAKNPDLDNDWVIMIEKDQDPSFALNPYIQPSIFPKLESLKEPVDTSKLKLELIKRFEHFYHQFTENIALSAVERQSDSIWQSRT